MKTAKILSLGLLTIGLAAIGCGSTTGNDSDSGTGGSGTDSDGSDTGGSGTDSDGTGTGGNGTDSGTDSGLGGNAGSDGSGASSNSGGSGQNGTGGVSLPDDIEFEYDPSKDMEPETCADVQIDSEEIFLDIFMILDRSGSMTRRPDPDGGGPEEAFGDNDSDGYCDIGEPNVGSRWCNAINAINDFFSDATTVGTGFSFGEFRGNGGDCQAIPMDVPFGIVEAGDTNGQLAALVTELNDNDPDGSTPTERAINTLIAETNAHVPTGTRRTIGVLITDGDPNSGCNDDVSDLGDILNGHFNDDGIPTYIIGMTGATADNLEEMAVGSGAEPHDDYCDPSHSTCSYYTVGDGNPQAFMAALDSIRSSVLGCEYVVPSSQVGISDLDTLDVQFTPEASAAAIGLTRVANEAACASASEFFVDLSGVDPIVKLCPATCDLRGEGASIDISLKCEGS